MEEYDKYSKGRLTGAVYGKDSKDYDIAEDAMKMFTFTDNKSELFPSVKKMQRDIVKFSTHIMNGDEEVCGHLTTGGSDSIANAVLAHKFWGQAVKGITKPNIVISHTTHLAFIRACNYYGLECRIVMLKNMEVDVDEIERNIDQNTVLIVGSATEYCFGFLDPIEELAKLALTYNVGFHVDCCLGGFIMPFLARLDPSIPLFDFRVRGVTSISMDTHKYACGPKGLSVLLFRTKEMQGYLNFNSHWEGGFYHSNSLSENKSGAIVAGTWATIQHLGTEGYLYRAKLIRDAVRKMKKTIETDLPILKLIGPNDYHMVSFQCTEFSTYSIGEIIKAKHGWYYAMIQLPHAMHMCVTEANAGMMEQFIQDIKDAIQEIKENPSL
jgi:sphinganine-1-phosphate aldolase